MQNEWKSATHIIYTHPKTPKPSKYVRFIHKFEPPELAQLDPSRNASEARFVGVAQRLQNKWKSIKMIIYLHHKKTKYLKYVNFITKSGPPEFAQLDPSRKASEVRFVAVAQTLQKQMEINQNDYLYTSKNTKIFKISQHYNQM